MNSDHLFDAAEVLIADHGRPRQANLKRAISTIYYALFHFLADSNADLIVGGSRSNRSRRAWVQTYRALQHGAARSRCERQRVMRRFPQEIQDFADVFCSLQIERHQADYNPEKRFIMDEVETHLSAAKSIVQAFSTAARKDRLAFAIYVLLDQRS